MVIKLILVNLKGTRIQLNKKWGFKAPRNKSEIKPFTYYPY